MSDFKPGTVRVLVVEDNLDDQELLRLQLRKTQLGEYVHFVTDPRQALQSLSQDSVFREGLIALFVDVHLPHLSGVELVRRIRTLDSLEKLPVVMMTSAPSPAIEAAARDLGVAVFAEKPITLGHFSKVVADLFHLPASETA